MASGMVRSNRVARTHRTRAPPEPMAKRGVGGRFSTAVMMFIICHTCVHAARLVSFGYVWGALLATKVCWMLVTLPSCSA